MVVDLEVCTLVTSVSAGLTLLYVSQIIGMTWTTDAVHSLVVGTLLRPSYWSWFDSSARLVSLISRIAVIIGDVLVLVVTWMKTAKLHSEAQQLDMKAPLATLLVRDGTVAQLLVATAQ